MHPSSAYLKSRTSGSVTVASKFGKVEKFAQVVHAMRAQLEEEIDLVEGQTVRITEVIDKDWWRGEVDGRSAHKKQLLFCWLFTFKDNCQRCVFIIFTTTYIIKVS